MNKKQMIVIVIIALILSGTYFFLNKEKNPYEFQGNTLSYSSDRGKVDYNKVLIEENKTFDLYKVDFDTRQFLDENIRVYGLLFIPKDNEKKLEKIPSVIFLPGGGGTKESRREIAEIIISFGYAVLVIDQRGIGETKGSYLNFDEDYKIFSTKNEPMQHLAVYDVLRSFDFLKEIKKIDDKNIAIIGESMGGRYGIIATAIDKKIKGVIGISTSGFHLDINPLIQGNDYMISVDSDHYIDKISPRKLFMMHCKEDKVVKIENAETSFKKAKEPKKLKIFEKCEHGYNPVMNEELRNDLKEIFEG